MSSLSQIVAFALVGLGAAMPAAVSPKITYPSNVGCGEVNVFYTGFPAYHPLVISRGFDPVATDIALRNDTANLVKAGFNVYVLFQGPDQPVSTIGDRMSGRHWGVTGQGWGMRNSTQLEIVNRFEENLIEYREEAPLTPTVFNWSPTSLAQSVIRHVPLNEDCSDKPGTLYGYEENCASDYCEKTTVITDGSLEKLLSGIEN